MIDYKKIFYSKLEDCYLSVKIKDFHKGNIVKSSLEYIGYVELDYKNAAWESSSEIKIIKNSFIIKNGVKTKEFWNGKITSTKRPLRLKARNICGDESIVEIMNLNIKKVAHNAESTAH